MAKDKNGHGMFQERIKKYLDEFAAKDPAFAEKYSAEGKSIEGCCNFIICEVKKILNSATL